MKFKKILSSLSIVLALSAFSTISFPDDSEARRFGGSRSIGRTVAPKPAPPAGASVSQQRKNVNQNQTAGGAAAVNRTGMFGGMLGGLLAGTLLGSLLMGSGFGGGGGFLDIIIIGLIAFFAFRFFKSRSSNTNSRKENNHNYDFQQTNNRNTHEDSNNAWDHLRSEPTAQNSQTETEYSNIPADFDTEKFLTGAKSLYHRMQESWDERDLKDIAQFTAPSFFAEIEKQFKEDQFTENLTPSKTEILRVEATVTDVNQVGNEEQVSVLFDVQMREEGELKQVEEIWNFTKTNQSGSWKLDGIQQV